MLLTIQIVNYNSRENLRACLRSIREHVFDQENLQIVVINNDKDKLEKFPEEFGVELIEKNENVGFGKAHNLALDRARGKYILLLNPDTKIFPETVEKMLEVFSSNERTGIVGPIHVGKENISGEDHYGAERTPLSTIREKISRRKEKAETENIFETDWVSGGAMMIRKDLFSELGGFDENYFMYFEDVDLCLQAKKKEWKIIVHPGAKIFHKSGQSFSDNRVKKKYYYQSQDHYIRKNFGSLWAELVKILRFPFYVRNVYCRKR
ncbi:MAG: glycosyltransferase family 2 protein [Candidatus Moranbacteria bacterium]|nr:glycosyltransferase family 2 protein [Candidatus Moranbacteria bacterium]